MHILNNDEYVLIESSDQFDRKEEGQKAIDYVKECMQTARLWSQCCCIAMGEEKVMVRVKGDADLELLYKGENYKAEVVSESEQYEKGQVVYFRLEDVLDVFPPMNCEEE
jgi:hypothetical protein